MAIKGKSITINLYAFDVGSNLPASGLSDISGYIIKDGASPASLSNSISEPDGANLPGLYEVQLTDSEMNADSVTVHGRSPSNPTGVVVYPWMGITESNYLITISGYTDSLEAGQTNIENKIDTVDTVVDSNSDKLDTISDYTDSLEAGQSAIESKVDTVDSVVDSNATYLNTISGYTDSLETQVSDLPDIDTIVSSGDAAGWGDTVSAPVTVSGHTPSALSQIVSSGDAAGWGATAQTGAIVSGIFDEVVNGTKDYRTAFEEIWAYAVGEVSASGSNPYKQTYQDMAAANIFTLNVSGQGRTRTY